VFGPDRRKATQLGLNMKPVVDLLRKHAFPALPSGGAYLRWQKASAIRPHSGFPFGVVVFLRQTVKSDYRMGYVEQATTLHAFVVDPDGSTNEIGGTEKAEILDGLTRSAPLRNKPDFPQLLDRVKQRERELAANLTKPSESEFRASMRHAVTPLFAAVVVE
jgi:hypothetical protein